MKAYRHTQTISQIDMGDLAQLLGRDATLEDATLFRDYVEEAGYGHLTIDKLPWNYLVQRAFGGEA